MPRTTVEVTCREEFSAALRLHNPELSEQENRRRYGICNNPNGHGHTFTLEVTVRGEPAPEDGMVVDFLQLESLIREEVLSEVDHKNLNRDVSFLTGTIPTTENLAVAFWERLEPRLKALEKCQLFRIRLFESTKNFVDYHGPTR